MTQAVLKTETEDLSRGASRKLAHHGASLTFDRIPQAVIDRTKQCVLDNLAVMVGASGLAEEATIVHDYVLEVGGRPESTLLGFGGKAPAAMAAFGNGAMCHMLDYEDTAVGPVHGSSTTVPVAFAIGEKVGGVSGKDLLAAIATAYDIVTRVGASAEMAVEWFGTQFLGFLPAAVVAGRLIGLTPEQMENALGIAFNQLCGSREMASGEATHLRGMQAGFSGQGGVLAALLAKRGITGPKEIFEGKFGIYRSYVREENPNWEALVGDLGTRFSLLDSHSFKVWPACAGTRPMVAGVLQLREEHNIPAEQIESILGIIGGQHDHLVRQGALLWEPIDSKRAPTTSIDAKYSIPFTAAVAAAKGNVTLRDYTDDGLADPETLAMGQKVAYRVVNDGSRGSTTVEIRTHDGKSYSKLVTDIPGDPNNPVDQEELEAKFRDCVAFSKKPVPTANVERVIELVRDLENVKDATEIMRLLA